MSLARPVSESEFVLGLQEEARRGKLSINVGIHEPALGGNRVKNTLVGLIKALSNLFGMPLGSTPTPVL